MITKVGIILPHVFNTQLTYCVVKNIYTLVNNPKYDFVIFFEDLTPPMMKIPCAMMNVAEIHCFNGTLISTTLNNTVLSLKAINQARKIFYVWDLEWLRGQNNYLSNLDVYRNPNLELFTRSESYAKAIDNYSNRLPKIATDFNLEQIC